MWIVLLLVLVVAAIIYFATKNQKETSAPKTSTKSVSEANNILQDAVQGAYGDVTLEQKLASAQLLKIFGATCNGSAGQIHQVSDIVGSYCGLMNISANQVRDSQQQFDSMDKIIDVLSSVKNKGFMDQLLYSCFCVVSINKSEQGANVLSAIFGKFGYSDDDCVEVIQKIHALGQMFK